MAAVDDLIAQVPDARLRERLAQEWAEASQGRKFGLVFEQHLPELLVMPRAKPRAGSRACVLGDEAKTVWRVRRVADGMAWLRREGDGSRESQELTVAADQLQVVRQFGDPIFPALTPVDRVQNGGPDAPWHTLIEADNYHALQLLDYLYAGKVDCIYIDPPYNTGARDWKYNNDYVDGNDTWRHSKWLAFMERRLKLAKRLLNPDSGVLIVTIDEHEVQHLGMLLEATFPSDRSQMVSTLINPANVARAGEFGRNDEYIFFVMFGQAAPDRIRLPREWVSTKGRTHTGNVRWDLLRRSGTNAARRDRPGLFYPIYVNPDAESPCIADVGQPLADGERAPHKAGLVTVLPIRKNRSEGNWQWGPETLKERMAKGRVRIGGNSDRGFTIYILKDGEYAKIQRGEFQEIGRAPDGSILVEDNDATFVRAVPGSQWRISSHDATQYGSRLVGSILPDRSFPFPKSVYAVRDTLRFFTESNPAAVIVDFFAGSGTTLNAVNLLNATDNGRRRCILVTNNEASGDEADALRGQGLSPGDAEWEAHGICQSVTWPRSKYTILGKRDDDTALDGEYMTGTTREVEKARKFIHIGFVDAANLNSVPKRKQLIALIDGLPQTLVKADAPYIVSESHDASVLFDPAAKNDWLEALEGQDHIARFFIVTPRKAEFDAIKAEVQELLGPLTLTEEEKRPMAEGFAANLEYFRLDFLEPARVQLRRAFREILPLLWLKAGAVGPRPTLARDADEPDLLLPEGSNFAVLLHESKVRKALTKLAKAPRLEVLYLVTDDEDAFRAMSDAVRDARGDAGEHLETVQLYRSYLDNFTINRADSAEGARS